MSIFNDTECADVNGECHYIEEMTLNHFLTVCIVFFGVYIIFMLILYCGLSSRLAHYKKLPRHNLDIGRERLSAQMKKKANASRQRIKRMVFKPLEASDKSYGAVFNETTGEYSLLNYQTAVAISYQTLEDDISKQYPNLKRTSKQDLRSYVKFLQTQFPKLTDTVCENYVKTYELAKFSDHEWTAEMFEEWYGFFREFANSLTLPSENYQMSDPRSPLIYNYSQKGIGLGDEFESSEDSDSLMMNMNHHEDEFD